MAQAVVETALVDRLLPATELVPMAVVAAALVKLVEIHLVEMAGLELYTYVIR